MLPTVVIGLREGLEASLIVGIVAAFLRQRGRLDLLRWVFAGVALAVALCVGVGVALDIVSKDLPQKQQEGLETVVGSLAVLMVTYMVIWMRRHSRDLKGQLEGAAGSALAEGSAWALVLMAFLAVLREGFETVVFLLAAFNESSNSTSAGLGAALGIAVAVVLGVAIYRGGVKLNLSKFFRITGIVLVLVAAGLVVTAFHTAHEAGWLNSGQQRTINLTSVVRPGTVWESLLTGMLGIQARPVLIEVVSWLVYLIPVGLYVAWPPGRGLARATTARLSLAAGAISLVAAVLLTVLVPSAPAHNPVTSAAGGVSAQVVSTGAESVVVSTNARRPAESTALGALTDLTLKRSGETTHAGVDAVTYATTLPTATSGTSAMTYDDIAAKNGGRLPIGVRVTNANATVPVSYTSAVTVTAWLDPHTNRVIDVRWQQSRTLTAALSIGATPIGSPTTAQAGFPATATAHAAAAAEHDNDALDSRSTSKGIALTLYVVGALLALTGLAMAFRDRRPGSPRKVLTGHLELARR
jgi:high-affinity iron transporter